MTEYTRLLTAAEAGDAEACFRLGEIRLLGLLGTPADLTVAIRWFGRAAKRDHVAALVRLARICLEDIPAAGGDRDPQQAAEWLERAAMLGEAEAMVLLAQLYLDGDGTRTDGSEALVWLHRACELGHGPAFLRMGELYAWGEHVACDLQRACELYEAGVDANDDDCRHHLALHLVTGDGVEEDPRRAVVLLASAAENGHSDAQFLLGLLFTSGEGVTRDEVAGFRWFHRAARADHVEATFELARGFRTGRGTPRDDRLAFELFRSAAAMGHTASLYEAGRLLEEGVPFDGPLPAEARACYRRAARDGHLRAATALADLYVTGLGGRRDLDRARELYEYVIGLGLDDAMVALARLEGCEPEGDELRALVWTVLAQRHGVEDEAEQLLRSLEAAGIATPERLAEATFRADEWRREPHELDWAG